MWTWIEPSTRLVCTMHCKLTILFCGGLPPAYFIMQCTHKKTRQYSVIFRDYLKHCWSHLFGIHGFTDLICLFLYKVLSLLFGWTGSHEAHWTSDVPVFFQIDYIFIVGITFTLLSSSRTSMRHTGPKNVPVFKKNRLYLYCWHHVYIIVFQPNWRIVYGLFMEMCRLTWFVKMKVW